MLIKIDLEKAYDRLSWAFIKDSLEPLGLPNSWKKNLMHCIKTTNMSVIWNGQKLDRFKPTRGIRQGDTIYSYLFVLCMERLGHLINQAVTNGRWKPVRLSKYGPPLSHFFFADDLLLFTEASQDQIRTILDRLNTFCSASKQKNKPLEVQYFFLPRGGHNQHLSFSKNHQYHKP